MPLTDTARRADDPATPLAPGVSETDLRQARVLGTSLAATVAGFAAAGFTVLAGGLAVAPFAALAAAGGARRATEKPPQLTLGAIEHPPPCRRKIASCAVDVEVEHRHRGLM